ncbi:MAG: hypothetical protein V4620_06955 [Bacteroidota bacterium]
MKQLITYSFALTALIIVACSTVKKTATPVTSPTPVTTVVPTPTTPATTVKSKTGVFAPGNEELAAIQVKYSEVTMKTLTEGHALYIGACTNCHGTKSIYNYSEQSWVGLINDMAPLAKLTATEKDAVYKYVLAIKATQPQETKMVPNNFILNPNRTDTLTCKGSKEK